MQLEVGDVPHAVPGARSAERSTFERRASGRAPIHREMCCQVDALAASLHSGPGAVAVTTEVRDGSMLQDLARVAVEWNACLVVVGSHRPDLAGSVARLLPPLAACPTAVVPHP